MRISLFSFVREGTAGRRHSTNCSVTSFLLERRAGSTVFGHLVALGPTLGALIRAFSLRLIGIRGTPLSTAIRRAQGKLFGQ